MDLCNYVTALDIRICHLLVDARVPTLNVLTILASLHALALRNVQNAFEDIFLRAKIVDDSFVNLNTVLLTLVSESGWKST